MLIGFIAHSQAHMRRFPSERHSVASTIGVNLQSLEGRHLRRQRRAGASECTLDAAVDASAPWPGLDHGSSHAVSPAWPRPLRTSRVRLVCIGCFEWLCGRNVRHSKRTQSRGCWSDLGRHIDRSDRWNSSPRQRMVQLSTAARGARDQGALGRPFLSRHQDPLRFEPKANLVVSYPRSAPEED